VTAVAGYAAMAAPPEVACEPRAGVTSLEGKVALVTGGTGSIGMAVARQLAEAGCHVAVVDLDEEKCAAAAAQLPTRSIGVAFDVSSEASVVAGVARVREHLGGVDILVNVAGILSNNKALETSSSEWRKVHAVNYDSAFYLSKACLPHMVEQGWGRVVNLSSWAWKSGGLTAGTAYSSSKAAMVGLTFSLARQFASSGVTVNAVAPCYVFSPMIMEQLTADKRAELLETIPVRRFCKPDEVAHAVAFLVSPLSGFITGEVIDMNGGFQMD
jgi:3-oxoacyl-[acyl-carrier protein] reductase